MFYSDQVNIPNVSNNLFKILKNNPIYLNMLIN